MREDIERGRARLLVGTWAVEQRAAIRKAPSPRYFLDGLRHVRLSCRCWSKPQKGLQ